VRVWRSTNQSIPNASGTNVSFDTKRWDTANMWSAGQPTRLTCQVAGKYVVVSHLRFAPNATGVRQVNFNVNGSVLIARSTLNATAGGAQTDMPPMPVVWDFNVGDYVEVSVYQTSGGPLNLEAVGSSSDIEFEMSLLGGQQGPPGFASPPTYATTLPASPVDGQEAILVDSVMNPAYTWRFRYNAGSTSAYKWEFVGGNPVTADVVTQENCTSTSAADLATPQAITIPRTGGYSVRMSAVAAQIAGSAGAFNIDLVQNATLILSAPCNQTVNWWATVAMGYGLVLNAGDVWRMRYHVSPSCTVAFQLRTFSILPQRVS